ncbi:MAG: NUDIX hydrolase [Firmicutes bacterium]|nr:NUDIX hydrolase [Bacillota bacterium]
MKLENIKKLTEGKFITRYDLSYKTVSGQEKIYEIISRDKNITDESSLANNTVDAVVIIAHNKDKNKILLNKEFRMAAGRWVYNFPAGLIDPGETPEEAAKRELKEETGLNIDTIEDCLGISYSAVGFSNEKNLCLICTASGTFTPSTSEMEEIEPGWYSKEEIKQLLKHHPFAARTQAYCYAWSSL